MRTLERGLTNIAQNESQERFYPASLLVFFAVVFAFFCYFHLVV